MELIKIEKGVRISTLGTVPLSTVKEQRKLNEVSYRYYSRLYPYFLRAKYRCYNNLNSEFVLGCPVVYFIKKLGYINDLRKTNNTQIKIDTRWGDVIRYRQDGRIKGIRGEKWEIDIKNLFKMGLIFDKEEVKRVEYSFKPIGVEIGKIEIETYLLRQYRFLSRHDFENSYKKGLNGWCVNMLLQNQININESEGFKWLVIGSKFKLYKLPDGLMLIKCFNFGLYYNDEGFYAVQDLYGQIYNVSDKDRKLLNDWIKIFRNGISYEKS